MTTHLNVPADVRQLLEDLRDWSVQGSRPLAREADALMNYPDADEVKEALEACPTSVCPMGYQEVHESQDNSEAWMQALGHGPNVVANLAQEEIVYGDHWLWQLLPGGRLAERLISKIGTPEQKERWVGGVDRGEFTMTSIAMTEQTMGSDIANIKLLATKDGDAWVLNGEKRFISNGAIADYILVFATTDPELGHKGVRPFIVEKSAPGFSITREQEQKIGWRHAPQSTLQFDDCRIPADQMLGTGSGRESNVAYTELNATRPFCVSSATGVARAALDIATEWVEEHRDEFSQERLDKMARDREQMLTALDDGRRLWLRAAHYQDVGRSNMVESAMAKSYVTPLVEKIVLRSLQMIGPEAATERMLLEKWYRDVKFFEILEGTGQILRRTIARQMLGSNVAE